MDSSRVKMALRVGLSAGGPIGAIILEKTHVSQADYMMGVELVLYLVPAGCLVWGWVDTKVDNLIAALAKRPEVATIVIKDGTNGKVGAMAASEAPVNAKVVTETQNEKDAKEGSKS